ncbi:hypothetical protein [Nocardia sp. NPDC051570]|uniref:hypothetical protein n=1 Tax=Nocardia sp. NPDC051570 TaxID=3364324 RepID=UPI0037BCC31E
MGVSRDERRTELARLTKKQLIAKSRIGIRRPDGQIVELLDTEGWTKDELIARMLDIQFPRP